MKDIRYRGELPEIPRTGSIARQMIDAWNGESAG